MLAERSSRRVEDTMPSSPIVFRALFEHSPNPYMVLDRELRYVAANAAYLEVTSSRLEDLLGVCIFDIFPHDPLDPTNENARRLRESLEGVLATGEPDTLAVIAYRVPEKRADGGVEIRERLWSATHTPIFGEEGEVTHVLQHTVDVTEVPGARERALEPKGSATAALAQIHAGILERASAAEEAHRDTVREYAEFRRIFDHAPGIVCVLRGPKHVFELANPAFRGLVGERDVVGKPFAEAMPDVLGQGYEALLDRVYATGQPFLGRGLTARLVTEPGAAPVEIVIDLALQPITNPAGAVVGVFAQAYDQTEQRRLERERVRLAMIVEQASDSIGVAAPDGKLVFLNEAGQRLVGLPSDRVASTTGAEFFAPEDLERMAAEVYPRLLAEGRWEGKFRYRHFETGELIPIHYNVFAVRDPGSQEILAFASVSRDIREQLAHEAEMAQAREAERAALEASRAQEAELVFLAASLPDHVWSADATGAVTYANERMATYFDVPTEQLLREGWAGVVNPADMPHVRASWVRSIETGQPFEAECRLLRRRDGAYRWHIVRALPLCDEAGQVIKWYGTNTDIDDLKRTEAERDQLIQKLSASNRELDQFAYVASHDLKSPLRGIANLAQWVAEEMPEGVDPTILSYLDLMRGRIARMNALIDGILSYSRAGRVWNRLEEVDTGALVAEVVKTVALPSEARVEVSPDLPRVVTDPVALRQVFTNLVENAVKHGRRRDVVVNVDVSGPHEVGEGLSPMYRFTVRDNGPGIDPAMHERLWGLFQVLQPRDEVEGSGVGLSVMKKLVEARGGKVGLESRPGEGATFWFTWPRTDEPSFEETVITPETLGASG